MLLTTPPASVGSRKVSLLSRPEYGRIRPNPIVTNIGLGGYKCHIRLPKAIPLLRKSLANDAHRFDGVQVPLRAGVTAGIAHHGFVDPAYIAAIHEGDHALAWPPITVVLARFGAGLRKRRVLVHDRHIRDPLPLRQALGDRRPCATGPADHGVNRVSHMLSTIPLERI